MARSLSPLETAILTHIDEAREAEEAIREFSDGPPTREIPAETMEELIQESRR